MRISGCRKTYSAFGVNLTWSMSSAWINCGRAVSPTSVAGSSPSNCDPITDAAFKVRFAIASNRSMRAAMAACNVAGTVASAAAPSDR